MSPSNTFSAAELADFALACHASLNIDRTAHVAANEVRRLLNADRVAVLVAHRGKLRVRAVSGQATVNRQSDVVVLLERLAASAQAFGQWPAVPQGEQEFPPTLNTALQAYLDTAHVRLLRIVPLAESSPAGLADTSHGNEKSAFGCLAVEKFTESDDAAELEHRAASLASHLAQAINNCLTHRRIFLLPLWERLGNSKAVLASRNRPKTAAFAILLILLIVAGAWPVPYRISTRGAAQPEVQRHLFAGEEGVVRELFVDHGDRVVTNAKLATLRSAELDLRWEQLKGEIATGERRLDTLRSLQINPTTSGDGNRLDADRVAAELKELEATLDAAKKQLELLAVRREALTLASPIAGQIVTWNVVEQLTARPVNRGQPMLTVADVDGPWIVEVRLPEHQYRHYIAAERATEHALDVSITSSSEPARKTRGRIRTTSAAVRTDEGRGRYVALIVELVDARPADWHPGIELQAEIECGKRSLAFVWLHEFWEFLQGLWF